MKKLIIFILVLVITMLSLILGDKVTNRYDKNEAVELFNEKVSDNRIYLNELLTWIQQVPDYRSRAFKVSTQRSEQVIYIDYLGQRTMGNYSR